MARVARACFALTALLGACGASDAERVVSSDAALVSLSPTSDVEPYPERTPVRVSSAKAACGPAQCLLLYEVSSDLGAGTFLYATRVDASGKLLDDPPKLLASPPPLGPQESDPGRLSAVAAGDDGDFLVVWAIPGGAYATAQPIRIGADGTVTPLFVLTTSEGLSKLTLAGGSRYLELDSTGALRRLSGDAFDEPVSPPAPASQIVPGDGQALLVGGGSVSRFDTTTGAFLDSTPLMIAAEDAQLHGVFAAGAYHLFWESPKPGGGAQLLSLRLARDGSLLDPDLTETPTPGARVQIDPAPAGFQAFAADDQILLVAASDAGLDVWRVEGTSGLPAGHRKEDSWPGADTTSSLVLGSGAGLLLTDAEPSTLSSVATSWSGAFGLDFGVATPFALRPEPRTLPFVAANDEDYAVTWRQPSGYYAARLDPATAAYSGKPRRFAALSSDSGERRSVPRVFGWRDAYEFAFLREAGTTSELVMGDVFSGSTRTLATDTGFDERGASAVCRGQFCLVTWVKPGDAPVLMAVRVDDQETSAPFPIGEGVVTEGRTPVVVAGPEPNTDFAWVFFAERTAEVGDSIWSRRYQFSTSALGKAVPVWTDGNIVAVESADSVMLLVRDTVAALLCRYYGFGSAANVAEWDQIHGSSFEFTAAPSPGDFELSSIWYDGISVSGIWSGMALGSSPRAFLRVSTLLRLRDEGVPAVDPYPGTVVSDDAQCSGASRGAGRSLIACSSIDHQRLGATVKTRFFEHDGAVLPGSGGRGGGGGLAGTGGGSSIGGAGAGGGTSSGGSTNAGAAGESAGQPGSGCGCRLGSANVHGQPVSAFLLAALIGVARAFRRMPKGGPHGQASRVVR